MERLTDIGARSIFTSEQVTLVDCADRCMQDMFREVVRKFMREQVAPQQAAFEEAGQPNREVWKALGAMVGGRWHPGSIIKVVSAAGAVRSEHFC